MRSASAIVISRTEAIEHLPQIVTYIHGFEEIMGVQR